jgi:AP-1 complex subunit mu
LEFFVTVKSNYKAKCVANNVEIFIPVPSDSHSPSFRILNASDGTCNYIPDKDCVMWNIKQFAGHKEKSMFINLALPTVVSPEREKYDFYF